MRRLLAPLRDAPIRVQLISAFALVLLIVVAFVFLYFPSLHQQQLERELRNKLVDITEMVAMGVRVVFEVGHMDALKDIFAWAERDSDLACIVVLDESRQEMASFRPERLVIDPAAVLRQDGLSRVEGYSYYSVAIQSGADVYGYAIVGVSRNRLQEEVDDNRTTAFLACTFALLLGIGLAWLVSAALSGSIRQIEVVALQIANGQTEVVVPDAQGGEIGGLAEAFRRMQKALRLIAVKAQRVAQGDLTQRAELEGDMAAAFNSMVDDLAHLVGRVRDSGLRVGALAGQMSAAIQQQTETASQQSAALSQTTVTTEELARTSGKITETSDMVVQTAEQTQTDAQNGVQTAEGTLEHMEDIRTANERSLAKITSLSDRVRQIGEVMDIVNGIADRTKLIAFNATLEAAGAGEAGKRFGVVAQEIRKLADSVVEATEDISDRITEVRQATDDMVAASEENRKTIARGVASTQETAASLNKILESARTTTTATRQISLSTQQQRAASDQLVLSLQDVSESARNFAAVVEETNQVAAALKDLAQESTALIDRFKTEEDAAPPA